MAKGLTAAKAKKILEDGTVRGKALTEKQKNFFGAVAGGATPLKKLNGGWLDKFDNGGVQPNYNDSNVSLPPGFKGYGYDKGGRAYNGAWNGPVAQEGIELNTKYIDSTFNANMDKRWVQRLYERNPEFYLEGQTKPSTHFMESGDGYVYPRVIEGADGQLKEVSREEGRSQGIKFPNDKIAQWFAKNYKKGTNVLKEYQMGGSLPGATGMMYARTSGTSPEEPNKAQDGTVEYGTPEYKKAYEEGSIFAKDADGNPIIPLDEVVIYSGVDYEKYPYYNDLSAEQRKYFNDDGPIGRGVRRAAYTKRGLAEDTRDMVTGMLVQQPLAALQAPQSLMVEGIESLRGRDANFLNTLTFDTQRLPSQLYGFEDKPGWDVGGSLNTAMDMVTDPMNLVGVGVADDVLKLGLKQGLKNTAVRNVDNVKQVGKYLTTQTPLRNANKINPWAFKPNSNKFYRQVDNLTYNEGLESGLIKGKQDIGYRGPEGGNLNLNKSFGDDAYYNKGSLYYKNNKDLPYLFEANLPEERFIPKVNGRTRKYTVDNTSVRVSKEPIPINDPSITTYKKDWLQGYKPIEVGSPTPAVSNAIDASIDPGIRSNLIRFGQDIMDTPAAQIRASEKFNKNWFNNPETIRRVEEMINQPSKVRAGMSETEILQDINMYNTMLDKTPNLSANLQAKIKDNLKDLNAGLAKRNLETVQQKGRFTEVFDENNLKHQEMALHYDENPGTLGLYKGSTNQASVNLERIKEKARDVGSVFTHEDLHAITAGKKGYTDEAKQILNDAVGKDQDWWLNKINTTKDQKKREELIDQLEYLSRPQEIHARVHELRKAFNLKPGQEVSPSKIEAIMTKGLKGDTPVDEGFFRMLGDKENFRKIFNKLPAFVPAAVGLGAASQNKNGGWLSKYQEGGEIPKAQKGKTIIVNSKDDPRYQAYQDSLAIYNSNQKLVANLKKEGYDKLSSYQPREDDPRYQAYQDRLEQTMQDYADEADGVYTYTTPASIIEAAKPRKKGRLYEVDDLIPGLINEDLGKQLFSPKIMPKNETVWSENIWGTGFGDKRATFDYSNVKPNQKVIVDENLQEKNIETRPTPPKEVNNYTAKVGKRWYIPDSKAHIKALEEENKKSTIKPIEKEAIENNIPKKPPVKKTPPKKDNYGDEKTVAYWEVETQVNQNFGASKTKKRVHTRKELDRLLKKQAIDEKTKTGNKNTLKITPNYYQDGGVIEDDRGQWAHPGKITKINSNNITMKGVNYPVLGISNTGDEQLMMPGEDYKFDGDSVTEYPMAQNGKQLQNLDQLTNFTNYNTQQPGGWLDKYH